MIRLPSGSGWQLLRHCLGPAVLPKVGYVSDAGENGTGMHTVLEEIGNLGREKALERCPPNLRARAEALDVETLPVGKGWKPEVAFVYNTFTGESRYVGMSIGRNYPEMDHDIEFGATLDAAFVDRKAGIAYYAEAKTGFQSPEADESVQLANGCLALARWAKVPTAKGAIVHIDEDARVTWKPIEFSADALEKHQRWLFEKAQQIAAVKDGGEWTPVTGLHCRSCPAFVHCPAQTAMVKTLARSLNGSGEVEHNDWVIDPQTAPEVYKRLVQVERALETVRETLRMFARVQPIRLGDSLFYGEALEEHYKVSDIPGALALISKRFGEEAAAKCQNVSIPKARIEALVKAEVAKRRAAGEKVVQTHIIEEFLTELIERGVAGYAQVTKWKEFRQSEALAPGADAAGPST